MFQGVFQHAIDAKGRTSLPAKFREQLAGLGVEKLFITRDLLDPCLVAFAPAAWSEIAEKVSRLAFFDPRTRLLSRGFIAPAQECAVDRLGRVLIPPTLRERLGNVEEITWAGQANRIEIWAPKKWAEIERAVDAKDAALLKQLSELL
jgi:MraZ protein